MKAAKEFGLAFKTLCFWSDGSFGLNQRCPGTKIVCQSQPFNAVKDARLCSNGGEQIVWSMLEGLATPS